MNSPLNENCSCPNPELCKRLHKHIKGRLWEIWNNININPEAASKYRELWEKQAKLKEVRPDSGPQKSGCGCKKN